MLGKRLTQLDDNESHCEETMVASQDEGRVDGASKHVWYSYVWSLSQTAVEFADRYNTALVCHRWCFLACHPRLWLRVDRSVKDLSQPGVFPSIETAVSAASPGDTILIAAGGSHVASNIQIKKPLCLIGGGELPDNTTLICSRGSDSALEFLSTCKLSNLTVKAELGCCLLHRSGRLTIDGCILQCESNPLDHLSHAIVSTASGPEVLQSSLESCDNRVSVSRTRIEGGAKAVLTSGTLALQRVRVIYARTSLFFWFDVEHRYVWSLSQTAVEFADRYNTALVCHRWCFLACHPRLWLRVDRSVKDLSQPGVFPSIETAVSAASPGDTILIAAGGSHVASNIQIKKPLCLIGGGELPDNTTLICSRGSDSALEFLSTCKLSNLTVKAELGCCLLHRSGRLTIDGCILQCESNPLDHLSHAIVSTASGPEVLQSSLESCDNRVSVSRTRIEGGAKAVLTSGTLALQRVRVIYARTSLFFWFDVEHR
ncbi:unnamed protein product [Ilex paraguariensis]|uniref:F-box protein SKIP5 n=1 Tax=Ilex paraguariensis TaxID=185542 RepID=A0ABC8RKX1_9AQUA